MRLGGSARRQPAASGRSKDERAPLLADKREPVGLIHRSVPERQPTTLESPQLIGLVADDPELGEPQELTGGEAARVAVLLEAVVGDELDDVSGRIVEVDGLRIPVLELEHVTEQLDSVPSPRERGVEAVAGNEQREVVEGIAFLDLEPEPCLADDDRLAVER